MKIVIANQKGGTGKTTDCVNIGHAFSLVAPTVLIDADPQGSLRDWYSMALDKEVPYPNLRLIALDRPSLLKTVPHMAEPWILVDSPGKLDCGLLISIADLVLIPIQPSPYDIWATEELISMVKDRMEYTPHLKAAFIISRQILNTNLANDIYPFLKEYGLPIIGKTCQRVIYATSIEKGRTVLNSSDTLAKAEIMTIYQNILKLLECPKEMIRDEQFIYEKTD